jgi:uncharacterized membrane protein YhaH (DUF805 family)
MANLRRKDYFIVSLLLLHMFAVLKVDMLQKKSLFCGVWNVIVGELMQMIILLNNLCIDNYRRF